MNPEVIGQREGREIVIDDKLWIKRVYNYMMRNFNDCGVIKVRLQLILFSLIVIDRFFINLNARA